ncbi:MAG: TonB-dependent receptor plug domain-containing protein, partial [Ignavibacteriales bacterium]|nr:TonB-dependent receptor plug domain-containing protein [Ignavibacteriales bacterium]
MIARLKISFLVFFALATYLDASAQTRKLSGFVRDAETGEALPGANVLVYERDFEEGDASLGGAAANRDGFFVVADVPEGECAVVVSHIGYRSRAYAVNVGSDSTRDGLNAELHSESVELDAVVVEARGKVDREIGAVEISTELFGKLPSFGGETNLIGLMENLPGVGSASELSTGLYVRGGSPDQTLTLVDDVLIYNPSHLGNFADAFNSYAVQEATLLKGATPAEYGGRLSGALDVKLRSGGKERFKGRVGLGAMNSHFAIEGPLGEKATYLITGRGLYYDEFLRAFDPESDAPRYRFFDLNAKTDYAISADKAISFSALFSGDQIYSPTDERDSRYDIEWRNRNASMRYLQITDNSVFLKTTVAYVDYLFRTELKDNDEARSTRDFYSVSTLRDLLIRQTAETRPHHDHLVKAGAELNLHSYELAVGDQRNAALESNDLYGDDHGAAEGVLFVQDDWKPREGARVSVGARVTYFDKANEYRIEPRASVALAPFAGLTLKAAYVRAGQFLHMIARRDVSLPADVWYPSTKNVLPSGAERYSGGFEIAFDEERYLIAIEGYYKSMERLYEFVSAFDPDPTESIERLLAEGEGEAYGAEFFFNRRAGDVTGWIGYSIAWTRRLFDELEGGRVFYPKYD